MLPESSIMILESSIVFLESSIMLLENIYSTGITQDDCHLRSLYFYSTGHRSYQQILDLPRNNFPGINTLSYSASTSKTKNKKSFFFLILRPRNLSGGGGGHAGVEPGVLRVDVLEHQGQGVLLVLEQDLEAVLRVELLVNRL
jgi:hypothetical protein